jgi:hypothetical protein
MFFSPFKIGSADNSSKNFWVGYETSDLAAIDVRKTDAHTNFGVQRGFGLDFAIGYDAPIQYRFDGGFAVVESNGAGVQLYDADGTYVTTRRGIGGGGVGVADDFTIDQNDVVYSTGKTPVASPQNVFYIDDGINYPRPTITLDQDYIPDSVRMLPNGNLVFTGQGPGQTVSIFISDPSGNILQLKDLYNGGWTTDNRIAVGPNRIFMHFDYSATGTQELYAFDHALGTYGQQSGIFCSAIATNQNDQVFTVEGNVLRRRNKDLVLEQQAVIGFYPIIQNMSTDQFNNIYFTTYDSGTGATSVIVYSQSSLTLKRMLVGGSDRFIGAAADYMPIGTKTIWE